MPVLPALQMILDAVAAGPPVKEQHDHRVTVEGGEIAVRVYVPEGSGPFPVHVYFHGGGFWLGTLAMSDDSCRAIAVDAGYVVASVDYRLAPETQWPLPAEDCYSALQWVVGHADELRIDPARVSVGGGSAGGNLAAVVSLMARDRSGPPLVLQVLADPADATRPYASPLLVDDLTGLPPALVMTAEFDPLRDEGEAYARRLAEAGVPVAAQRWDGQFHGSQGMAALIPAEAAAYHAQVVDALRRAHRSG